MSRLVGTVLLITLALLILVTLAAGPALAGDSCSVRQAKREMVTARAEYREAVRILEATRYYSRHDYSDFAGRYVRPEPVGRWVKLARNVGWPWKCIDRLMHIIARESSGHCVMNTQGSGAGGLLQLMPGWYRGTWGPPAGNPLSARYNLRTGLWIWRHGGWSAWEL